jgi:hypothetical protein
MSSRHGGQSMSHPIITLYLVCCISRSNSWSTSLALTKKSSIETKPMFQIPFLNFWKQIYRSLARGLRKLCNMALALQLQILGFAISCCMPLLLDTKLLKWSQKCCCLHGYLSRKHFFGIGIKMRIDRRDLKKIPTQTQHIPKHSISMQIILQAKSNKHSSHQAN